MTDVPPNAGQTLVIVLPSILAFLTSALVAILAYLAHKGSTVVGSKVEDLHMIVNSRLDALVEATRSSARAEGVVAGTQSERDRVAGIVPDTTADRQAGGFDFALRTAR